MIFQGCFCEAANKAIGGAEVICAYCFLNNKKPWLHLVYFKTTANGTHIVKDRIGSPRVKPARVIGNFISLAENFISLTDTERLMFGLQSVQSANDEARRR